MATSTPAPGAAKMAHDRGARLAASAMEPKMAGETIEEGFEVFVHDGDTAFGAVRKVRPHSLVVYVENSGDYTVPLSAVRAVHSGKVIVDAAKLDHSLRRAIGHAHDAEDPNA
jgi:hypothetical protein